MHLIILDDPSPDAGGIQNMAYWIGYNLADQGFRVVMAGRKDSLNRDAFARGNMELFEFKRRLRTKYSSDLRLIMLLLRLRLRYKRNVIFYSMTINNVKVFRLLKPFLPWHCVSFLHGNETLRLLYRRPNTLAKNLLACDCVFANSRYTKDLVGRLRIFPNVSVVSPGIPAETFAHPRGDRYRRERGWIDKKVILMLSRLVKRKGHGTVIEAVSRLRRKYPDIRLAIAGTGRFRKTIEAMTERAGIADLVEFLGFVPEREKPDLYSACDVFCMPSEVLEQEFEVEGFGITLLEASALGKIVIGSTSGGIPDAVEDRKSGFLVAPGDVGELSALLDAIFSRPGDFEGIRAFAKKRALSEFDWSVRVNIMLQRIEEAIVRKCEEVGLEGSS